MNDEVLADVVCAGIVCGTPRTYGGSKPGDLTLPNTAINKSLAKLMACEANLLGRVPLPFGLSLVAVVRKQSDHAEFPQRHAA